MTDAKKHEIMDALHDLPPKWLFYLYAGFHGAKITQEDNANPDTMIQEMIDNAEEEGREGQLETELLRLHLLIDAIHS